jgi:integrase
MKISDTWLQNAKPRKTRYDVTVTNRKGLMVRVHPSGVISFRLRYKRAGAPYVMVLGEYGGQGISLKDAYRIHEQARSEIERGLDPIEEQEKRERTAQDQRAERVASGTVADIVEQFVHRKLRAERWDEETNAWVRETKADKKARMKPRKRPEVAEQLLKANLVDKIGKEKARDVTRRQLIQLLDGIVDRGAPVTANRVYSLLKQCFEFAASKDLIPASPMAGVPRLPGGEESNRDRALNEDEVRAFWTGLDTAKMADATKLGLKLLLVTGQRRGEVTAARWTHFELDAAAWTIPAELSKNGKAHRVPLSPLAIQILKDLRAITGERSHVLASQHNLKKPEDSYSERVLSRAVRKNEAHFGIPHFTPHDLRRTAATMMTAIGVPRLHVAKVLNHSTGDITAIYDRHDYSEEKKAALNRWADHLTAVLANKKPKVIPLHPVNDESAPADKKSARRAGTRS